MNFLFPLFLLAGLAIVIPIIIHLFNFRKFKTIYFSDTRLLQQIKITSQKSRKIQDLLLLLSRILFVLALVFAFAQPFWGNTKKDNKGLQIIYVDNSLSMADNQGGQRKLLNHAIDQAKALINTADQDQQFIFLSNTNIYANRPIGKAQILEQLQTLSINAKTISLHQINEAVNNALEDNNASKAAVHIFSDLQKSTLLQEPLTKINENVSFFFNPISHKESSNLYIDTAYFTTPVLDNKSENELIVRLGKSNTDKEINTQVQVWINDQVRAAKEVHFTNDTLWSDTIKLLVNTPGWHKIAITVKDAPIQFDDTFRITAKTNATLSILNLSDGNNSPYLQAAFSPINGFMVQQGGLNTSKIKNWPNYNLIVLQNIQSISLEMANAIKQGLQNGQSFFLIPNNIGNINSFNQSLGKIAPITFSEIDTTRQQIGSIQTEHVLLKDVIASMPPNAQLPLVLKHYPIVAGLSAAQQSVMNLKTGKPYLAQYHIDQGSLFIISGGLDEHWSNFVLSNLFMPILYRMTSISGTQAIYAVNANSNQPIFIPQQSIQRTVFKVFGADREVIPPQNPYGNGVNIYLGKAINEPGFYTIKNESSKDSTIVAINSNELESKLEAATEKELIQILKPAKVSWQNGPINADLSKNNGSNALWKWLIAIALLSLGIETYLLMRKRKTLNPQK
ncbi:MAG TPA: BatA domain-containing protein [Edaphocola sp.]|nr:BatA domain-containing protein [Edaphocola sp.]